MAVDPVCGMEVETKNAKERANYQGETYYFCSSECKKEFEKAPMDYVGDEGMESTGT